jgi:hypothetical protein
MTKDIFCMFWSDSLRCHAKTLAETLFLNRTCSSDKNLILLPAGPPVVHVLLSAEIILQCVYPLCEMPRTGPRPNSLCTCGYELS